MPFDNHTPEALLGRADSKNPATTCRGLTTAGKPCRRSLATTKSTGAAKASRSLQPGVVAVVEGNRGQMLDAAFYCWQHKDQATTVTAEPVNHSRSRTARLVTVTERTSMDSLVERLGIARVSEPQMHRPQQKGPRSADPRIPRDSGQHHSHGREEMTRKQIDVAVPPRHQNPKPVRRRPGLFSSLCCFGGSFGQDDDYYEIVRHRRAPQPSMQEINRREKVDRATSRRPVPQVAAAIPTHSTPELAHYSDREVSRKAVPIPRRALSELPPRATNQRLIPSPTQRYLSYIPPTVKPETAAILLTELAKPISPHDDEGYIYIFWLTDTDKVPDAGTASTLLSQPTMRARNLDTLARTYSKRVPKQDTRRTIMLKIGRANNVHRRMTEWTQQCGYALSLVRWYPYISSSPQASPRRENLPHHIRSAAARPSLALRSSSDQVRKVPHVHRVERLIHLELADKRVKRNCEACGKEHREWFEIEATEQGVKAVDDVVRRWTAWAEQHQT
ncbi:Hypothetical protein D9617_13g099030 [Elsinoe fawcettii]|nr:Hypothetical protein D9617_13g099030 [Elsinoe fawcettii]